MTDDPAEVDICGKDRAERNRYDLSGVCAGQGLEDTPWDTTADKTDQKHLNVLSEEDDEDEKVDGEESAHHGLPVTESIRNITVEEETEEFTDEGTVGETGLPCGSDLPRSIRELGTISLLEGGGGEERVDENLVEPLHDNGCREQDGPSNSLGVKSDTLAQGHLLLHLCSLAGIEGDLAVVRHVD